MNAIVIAVGDELTSGQTVDTNSAYLSGRLAERGIETIEHRTVGDSQPALAAAIRDAAARAEIVIVSGGLGPTEDDLTRAALAEVLGCPLQLDPRCLADIEQFFRLRQRTMADSNRIQAMIPAAAKAMPNEVGTAPGIEARLGQAAIFVVPGVPMEMMWMYDHAILPRLPGGQGAVLHRVIHTFGQGESDLGSKIADLMRRGADPTVGTTVAAGMVSVRIISRGASAHQAAAQADEVAAVVRQRLGELVVGEGEQTMASAVGDLLRSRRQSLSTAESCTGGLVGQLLTAVSGSSDYYAGGFVTYSNRLKEQLLGVPAEMLASHGAVSEPVARAMAEGCRQRAGSDWAISVTGIAGPTGGTAEKPVGLVYTALAGPQGTAAARHIFPGSREMVRLRSALAALNALRLELQKR